MKMYGNNVGLLSQNESLQINHGIKFKTIYRINPLMPGGNKKVTQT